MKVSELGHFLGLAEMFFELFGAVAVIVEAIRRDPRDRVLLFEVAAFVTLPLGALLLKFSGFFWPVILIWLILFFGFTLAAAYFALINWLRRTKRAS